VVLVGLVPDASEAMGLEANATGLAVVVRGAASFGQVIRRDNQSRLHLVAFGVPDCAIDTILNSRRFLTMIEALAKACDHVVIDAGDLGGATLRLAAIAPRGVLIASDDTQCEAASGCRMLAGAGFTDVTARDTVACQRRACALGSRAGSVYSHSRADNWTCIGPSPIPADVPAGAFHSGNAQRTPATAPRSVSSPRRSRS
jgi:hypothetical protein